MRIVSLLTPCTLSLKEQQRETPCICEVAWRSPFQNPNLAGKLWRFCSSWQWQLSICAICPQSLSFKWPWRRVMAESDVLDILLLAHISCAASNSFMIFQPGAWTPWSEVTISQVIIVTALSLQAFCTKFRPSLGALVGRIFAAWRCRDETVFLPLSWGSDEGVFSPKSEPVWRTARPWTRRCVSGLLCPGPRI